MSNRQVPRSEWFNFFQEFSRRHEGWLATVRVLHSSIGNQVEARDLPFMGVVSNACGSGPISLHLGTTARRNIEHEIASPKQVWVELSDRGAEEALGVVSEDGTQTILEFRARAMPEEVDGIVGP